MGIATSGVLPMVFDNTANANDYTPNTGGSIGGSPFQDGGLRGFSPNFDIAFMTLTSTKSGTIGPFDVGQVPVPAAVWLFGSGFISLIGLARRKV